MSELKYKIGDKVLIKSIDWWNDNNDNNINKSIRYVKCKDWNFISDMKKYCGKIFTIKKVHKNLNCYKMSEDNELYSWTDEMIECKVEDKPQPKFNIGDIVYSKTWQRDAVIMEILPDGFYKVGEYGIGWFKSHEDQLCKEKVELPLDKAGQITDFEYEGLAYTLPEGYQFVDENDNVINTTKISLRKKKEIIPDLFLDSIRTVREYSTEHSRIWLEIYEDSPNLCIFTHLLVDEDYRQRGYGTKALEQAEIIAKDLGCETIHLKVETNSWMSKWYLRSGYKFLTNAEDNYTWLTKSI